MKSNTAEVIDDQEIELPIEPELSEVDHNDNKIEAERVKTQTAVPAGIKFMLVGVVVFMIVAVFATMSFMSDEEYEPVATGDAYVDPVDIANGKQMAESIAAKNALSPVEGDLSESLINQNNKLSAMQDVSPLETESGKTKSEIIPLREVENDLGSLKSEITEHGIDIAQLNETISNLKQDDIAAIKKQLADLLSDVEKIKPVIKKHDDAIMASKKAQAASRNRVPNKPPFDLVSIDVWGGNMSAVLLMHSKTSFAQVGDVKAGWKVVNIERPDCISVKSIALNKTAKLCRKATI